MTYHTITNSHRGQIWFETQTGEGSTFFIKLPIAKQDKPVIGIIFNN